MNAIQIVRDSKQFPQMERISENQVNFYFDKSERPYGSGIQYMAVMVTVETQSDDIDEVKALALEAIKEYRTKQIQEYDKSKAVNEFFYNEESMWLDDATRTKLAKRLDVDKKSGLVTTKVNYEGKTFVLPVEVAETMLFQLEQYARDSFDKTNENLAAVAAIEDADAAISYDFKIGYPEKLHFNL